MKYLKNINQLFEELRDKSKLTVKEFSEEIDQYLYPFSDIGYQVENRYHAGGGISIYKGGMQFKKFIEFSNIKLDLFSLLSYISEVTNISEIKIFYYKSENDGSMDKFNISIRKKEFREDILSDIKDNYLITSIYIEL